MTVHSWATTADIPPSSWAAMGADMAVLLEVSGATGAVATGPDGTGAPVLDADRFAFMVTSPAGPPVVVNFLRAAGSGEVTTSTAVTGGLVEATLARARAHFSALFTHEVPADPASVGAADRIRVSLFDAGDRALVGLATAPGPEAALRGLVARAQGELLAGPIDGVPLEGLLGMLIDTLSAYRAGWLTAAAMLGD